jgi:hypothetical protein
MDLTCPECGAKIEYVRGDFSVGYVCRHTNGCPHEDAWYADLSWFRNKPRFAWLVRLIDGGN